MPAHDPTHPRATPIIVATASVTLAIGISVGAWTGYLTPPQPPEPSRERGSSPSRSTPALSEDAPAIVLVPVTNAQPAETAGTDPAGAASADEAFVAAYEPAWHEDDDEDHEHRSGHHEREHDDHDED